jgi:organic hydroperoxide reductase OsmC/OhrA
MGAFPNSKRRRELMQALPHHYSVDASGGPQGDVALATDGVDALPSAPPVEYGGPGGRWSPESLLVAAVADCFVLSFRGVARAAQLPWTSVNCTVIGTLDKDAGKTRFTAFDIRATLAAPPGVDVEKATRLLEKAESGCLITNSLSATTHLTVEVHEAP